MTIVICVVQGRPRVIVDDDGEPQCWDNLDEGIEWVTEEAVEHLLVVAAELIIVLDCSTGEMETL